MAKIEKALKIPISTFLVKCYQEFEFSDMEIASFVYLITDKKISGTEIWRWRQGLGIESRNTKEASIAERGSENPVNKQRTKRMRSLEIRLSIKVGKVTPFFFSIGKTYQELREFLARFTNKVPAERTLYDWMKGWGYQPAKIGKDIREKKRKARIAQALRAFHKTYPDAKKQFFAIHPEVRKKLSLRAKEMWQQRQKEGELVFCAQVGTNIERTTCQEFRGLYLQCQECEAKDKN